MANEISILADAGMQSLHIALILRIPEDSVHKYLDEEQDVIKKAEETYYEHHYQNMLKEVEALKKEIPENERREMRRVFLSNKIKEIKQEYLKTPTEEIKKDLKRLLLEAKIYTGEQKGFSPSEVARAREFPITRLIKNRNNMATCPFHKDNSPSLNLKNNFYYCHGCGAHGDVIDFVMKKDGLSFGQAIMKLHQ